MDKVGEHAVVLGGSMAGLLAARVLTDAYELVTIVERDRLADDKEYRRGVPQGRHAHALLPRGALIMNDLFPGLLKDLEADGVPVIHDFTELHFVPQGHRPLLPKQLKQSLPFYLPSRPYLELQVRRRVRSLANVDIIDQCNVIGLMTTPARDRVTGVHVSGHDEPLRADLVVDALGRGSRTPAWLEELGYRRPPEDQVQADVRYVSQVIRLRPGALREKDVLVGPVPHRPTGMGFLANEDDTWMFTIGAMAGHPPPPTEPDRMVEFITDFAPAHVVSAIRNAKPLTDVSKFRFPDDRWRRYDKLQRFPDGLVVIGDAVCTFNPIYGQGMSVAATEAAALKKCLRRGGRNLSRRYFGAVAKQIKVAWMLAAGGDLKFLKAPRPQPLHIRISNAYEKRYLAAAEHDTALGEQLWRVVALVDPPSRMFRPALMWRVMRRNKRLRRSAVPIDLPPDRVGESAEDE